jgi:hypothetical protein
MSVPARVQQSQCREGAYDEAITSGGHKHRDPADGLCGIGANLVSEWPCHGPERWTCCERGRLVAPAAVRYGGDARHAKDGLGGPYGPLRA